MKRDRLEEYQEGLLWSVEEDGALVIGATASALEHTGALGSVDAAEPGDEFRAGDWIGELRGKNSVLEITAPCDLKVLERNEEVLEHPSLLEDDPTGDAWLLRAEKLG